MKSLIGQPIFKYKLDPKHEGLVNWTSLSGNMNAIHILEKHLDKLDWNSLSENPNAIPILEQHLDKVNWNNLSENPNAIHILEQHLDKVNWSDLSENPNAIHILERHFNNIDWMRLSSNPNAIHILETHLENVYWFNLSKNPNAVHILYQHIDKIDWFGLSLNPNPDAIRLLEKHMDFAVKKDIDIWIGLSQNPAAIQLLETYPDNINWGHLSTNPNAIHLLDSNLDKTNWCKLCFNPAKSHSPYLIDKYTWRLSMIATNANSLPFIEKHFIKPVHDEIEFGRKTLFDLNKTRFVIGNRYFLQALQCNPNALHWLFHRDYQYNEMKNNNIEFAEELAKTVFHPHRLEKMANIYCKDGDVSVYLDILG